MYKWIKFCGGGNNDTTRRQLLKSSVGALGTLYLAPATLSLLTAERATAQSNNQRDVQPPTGTLTGVDSARPNELLTFFYDVDDETELWEIRLSCVNLAYDPSPIAISGKHASGSFQVATGATGIATITITVVDAAGNETPIIHTVNVSL